MQNNSNPGSVVAQVAYADSSGDCTNPGTIVYTTPSVSLQNPQTQVSGSVTGLYADVAYCWRLKATVTGTYAGEYDGNWQYFITNGTYHAYAGEPSPASVPAARGRPRQRRRARAAQQWQVGGQRNVRGQSGRREGRPGG